MPRRLINIDLTGDETPRVAFVRSPRSALLIDLVSWANNDSEQAHWPAPVIDDVVQQDGFMPQAIPPDTSSPDFAPNALGEFPYVCVLHPEEKGVLNVVSTLSLGAPLSPPPQPQATAPPSPPPKLKAKAKAKAKAKPKPKPKTKTAKAKKAEAKKAKAKAKATPKRTTKKKSKS